MALFQRKPDARTEERRTVQRHSVNCAASFKMLGGDRQGRLTDLSEAGARFACEQPPLEGGSGLLIWNIHEYFCKVVWSNGSECGVLFERPIPYAIVHETVDIVEVQAGPVAKFDNIPVARKGRRATLVTRES